jgi:hypothetical protein
MSVCVLGCCCRCHPPPTALSHPFYVDIHALVCVMYEDALAATAAQGQQHSFVFPHHDHPTLLVKQHQGLQHDSSTR